MGDRCSMTMEFGGHIETVEQLVKIIEAINGDCGEIVSCDHFNSGMDAFLARCAATGEQPYFQFNEVNYAELECAATLAEMGFDVYAFNDSGGDYGAGHHSWNGLTGKKFQWDVCEDNSLKIREVEAAVAKDDPVAAIRQLIAVTLAGHWVDLRPLTISNAVRDHVLKGPAPAPGTAHFLALAKQEG